MTPWLCSPLVSSSVSILFYFYLSWRHVIVSAKTIVFVARYSRALSRLCLHHRVSQIKHKPDRGLPHETSAALVPSQRTNECPWMATENSVVTITPTLTKAQVIQKVLVLLSDIRHVTSINLTFVELLRPTMPPRVSTPPNQSDVIFCC